MVGTVANARPAAEPFSEAFYAFGEVFRVLPGSTCDPQRTLSLGAGVDSRPWRRGRPPRSPRCRRRCARLHVHHRHIHHPFRRQPHRALHQRRQVQQKLCCITLDFATDMKSATQSSDKKKACELPTATASGRQRALLLSGGALPAELQRPVASMTNLPVHHEVCRRHPHGP